jgi:hypothetical protein
MTNKYLTKSHRQNNEMMIKYLQKLRKFSIIEK